MHTSTIIWFSWEEKLPPMRQKVLVKYRGGVTVSELRDYQIEKGKKKVYFANHKNPKYALKSVTHWAYI